MKTITIAILALIAFIIVISAWQMISTINIANPLADIDLSMTTIVAYIKQALPSLSWVIGLFAVVLIGALPFLFGLALDGKGQSASGWLLFIGAIFSAFAVVCLLAIYLGGSLLYALFNWIF